MSQGQTYQVEIKNLTFSRGFFTINAKNVNIKKMQALEALEDIYEGLESAIEPREGDMCIAKVGPHKYERCRLIKKNAIATVNFIDSHGNGEIPFSLLRYLTDNELSLMKSLCRDYILAELTTQMPVEDQNAMSKFNDLLIGKFFRMSLIFNHKAGWYVDLERPNGEKLKDIIAKDACLGSFIKLISIDQQMKQMEQAFTDLERAIKHQGYKPISSMNAVRYPSCASIATQESSVPINKEHLVRVVSFELEEENVQKLFVRFIEDELDFQCFHDNLQKYVGKLDLFTDVNCVNTFCLVLYEENLHRCVISSGERLSAGIVNVVLLDSGAKAIVHKSKLFKMPKEIVGIRPYSRQFVIADYPSTDKVHRDGLNFYLKYVSTQKVLTLKIVANLTIPSCQLFDEDCNVVEAYSQLSQQKVRYAQQLPLNDIEYEVTISSVETPKRFYVHLSKTAEFEQALRLRESLQQVKPPKFKNPIAGDACIVAFNGFNERGLITAKSTNEIFAVQFVDTGFIDEIHSNDIMCTAASFMKIPPIAYECCLSMFAKEVRLTRDSIKEFNDVVKQSKDARITMRIKNAYGISYVVELRDSETREDLAKRICDHMEHFNGDWTNKNDLNQVEPLSPAASFWTIDHDLSLVSYSEDFRYSEASDLNEKMDSFILPNAPKSCSSSAGSSSGVSSLPCKIARDYCRVTALVSPTDFTIIESNQLVDYKKFCENLQDIAQQVDTLKGFCNNTRCLALHLIEKRWCRAIILDVAEEDFFVTVKCLDDGTTFSIHDPLELKEYPESLQLGEYFGIQCSLPVKYFQEQLANDYLIQLMKSEFIFQKIGCYKQKLFIELLHNDQNVADILVGLDFAKRIVVAPSGPAYIVKIFSMKNFAIQMDSDTETLKILKNFTSRYKKIDIRCPQIGMLVLAFHIDAWYRGKILKITCDNTFHVHLIDYGHSETIEEIGHIDDPLIEMIHPIAFKCSLEDSSDFSSENEQKFKDLANRGFNKVNVKLVEPTEDFAIVNVLEFQPSVEKV